jgi:hypothetical protein
MKKIILLATCLYVTAFSFQLFAQQDADAQKAWMENMTPGPVHAMLAKSDGQWKVETTVWMAPGQEPVKGGGTCTNAMILGGRYQQSMHKGEMMGMPFEGMNLLGYDNTEKVFTSTWVDNMGTGTMTIKGAWDEATKSINFKGSMLDPMSGKNTNIRELFTIVDDNNQKMEMFVVGDDGKENKTMEIKFTRM